MDRNTSISKKRRIYKDDNKYHFNYIERPSNFNDEFNKNEYKNGFSVKAKRTRLKNPHLTKLYVEQNSSNQNHQEIKRTWDSWSYTEMNDFFSCLESRGKAFDELTENVKTKTYSQVRYFYYRILNKVSKYIKPKRINKKDQEQVINALLLFWELKKQFNDLDNKERTKEFASLFKRKACSTNLFKTNESSHSNTSSQEASYCMSYSCSKPNQFYQEDNLNLNDDLDILRMKHLEPSALKDSCEFYENPLSQSSFPLSFHYSSTNEILSQESHQEPSNSKASQSSIKKIVSHPISMSSQSWICKEKLSPLKDDQSSTELLEIPLHGSDFNETLPKPTNSATVSNFSFQIFGKRNNNNNSSSSISEITSNPNRRSSEFNSNSYGLSIPQTVSHEYPESKDMNLAEISERLTLQFTPREKLVCDQLVMAGYNPKLQLKLRYHKTISFVISYMENKWTQSINGIKYPIAMGPIRVYPLQSSPFHKGWGKDDKDLTIKNLFDILCCNSDTLALEYSWISPLKEEVGVEDGTLLSSIRERENSLSPLSTLSPSLCSNNDSSCDSNSSSTPVSLRSNLECYFTNSRENSLQSGVFGDIGYNGAEIMHDGNIDEIACRNFYKNFDISVDAAENISTNSNEAFMASSNNKSHAFKGVRSFRGILTNSE